jgi:hypothetical protein
MDLENAVAKHAEWKTKFRGAITKQEQMDASTISKDNCCDLGKWLHGEAKSKFSALNSYKDCVTKHALFHTEAGKVASAINSRKYSEAESMINAGTIYASASSAVGVAILKLKKEAAL